MNHKSILNILQDREMLKGNLILEVGAGLSAFMAFLMAHWELLGAMMTFIITLVISSIARYLREQKQIQVLEDQRNREHDKHLQEMKQDEERHQVEIEILKQQLENKKN